MITRDGGSKHSQQNPQQIDTNRSGLPDFAERIASNPEPRTTDERESRDLYAQETASLWNFWSLVVSSLGLVITGLGTGLLLWQIVLTRKAVEDTGEATKAMREANKIARANSHRELRAYLAVKAVTLEESDWDDNRLVVTLEIQNHGQTPANLNLVVVTAQWAFEGGDITLLKHTSRNSIRCHRDVPMHMPFSFSNEADELEKTGHFIVYGRVEYTDVFGSTQKEGFSFQTPYAFFLAMHEHSFPVRLAAFSALAIVDGIEAEKAKRADAAEKDDKTD